MIQYILISGEGRRSVGDSDNPFRVFLYTNRCPVKPFLALSKAQISDFFHGFHDLTTASPAEFYSHQQPSRQENFLHYPGDQTSRRLDTSTSKLQETGGICKL